MLNQAVIFTKPLIHLDTVLTEEKLYQLTQNFFTSHGFNFTLIKKVNGSELASKNKIDYHYRIYSHAVKTESLMDLNLTNEGKENFKNFSNSTWEDEINNGTLMATSKLLLDKKISTTDLSVIWNECASKNNVAKIQPGLIISFSESINAYLINGFYPLMSEYFSNPSYNMSYFVVEFNPSECNWSDFRNKLLGITNSSQADKDSFRGRLFSEYPLENPISNNFVHGSAGPFEGLIERIVHEESFEMANNPIGNYLGNNGISLSHFKSWIDSQLIHDLSSIFDLTEEKNTDDVLSLIRNYKFD